MRHWYGAMQLASQLRRGCVLCTCRSSHSLQSAPLLLQPAKSAWAVAPRRRCAGTREVGGIVLPSVRVRVRVWLVRSPSFTMQRRVHTSRSRQATVLLPSRMPAIQNMGGGAAMRISSRVCGGCAAQRRPAVARGRLLALLLAAGFLLVAASASPSAAKLQPTLSVIASCFFASATSNLSDLICFIILPIFALRLRFDKRRP